METELNDDISSYRDETVKRSHMSGVHFPVHLVFEIECFRGTSFWPSGLASRYPRNVSINWTIIRLDKTS